MFDGPGGVKWYLNDAEIAQFTSPGLGEQGARAGTFCAVPEHRVRTLPS